MDVVDAELAELRARAQDALAAGHWTALLKMESLLRADVEFWRDMWAPRLSLAAHRAGRPDARRFLDEAVSAGFSQVDLYRPELTGAFGGDPDWPDLVDAMAANVPAAPITLSGWPQIAPHAPISLDQIQPHRLRALQHRLPEPADSAWHTALTLLGWVSGRWRHANAHINVSDAVTILEQAALGARFACMEYSIVLSQALNAIGIPARRVLLRQADYHVGIGKGHVVSEAWIDELDAWVVLDGQNGMYWIDADDRPMSLPELQDACLVGSRPRHIRPERRPLSDGAAERWFGYFRHARVTGLTWAVSEFVPTFQDSGVDAVDMLLRDRELAYPRLSDVGIGVAEIDGRPALRIQPLHPFAIGWRVVTGGEATELDLDTAWSLPTGTPGHRRVELAVRTPHAMLATSEVTFRIG